jgi:hypothetical protein
MFGWLRAAIDPPRAIPSILAMARGDGLVVATPTKDPLLISVFQLDGDVLTIIQAGSPHANSADLPDLARRHFETLAARIGRFQQIGPRLHRVARLASVTTATLLSAGSVAHGLRTDSTAWLIASAPAAGAAILSHLRPGVPVRIALAVTRFVLYLRRKT